MNSTVDLIFTVVGAALVLLTVYGAIKLDRKLFLSGICFFSLLPIIGEGMAYNADKAPIHVLVFFVFVIQMILAWPNKIVYGTDNVAATKLATKIAWSLFIINAVGAVFIFCFCFAYFAVFQFYSYCAFHLLFC